MRRHPCRDGPARSRGAGPATVPAPTLKLAILGDGLHRSKACGTAGPDRRRCSAVLTVFQTGLGVGRTSTGAAASRVPWGVAILGLTVMHLVLASRKPDPSPEI
jgi:hypothetical protein